jgi:hypothetical protein
LGHAPARNARRRALRGPRPCTPALGSPSAARPAQATRPAQAPAAAPAWRCNPPLSQTAPVFAPIRPHAPYHHRIQPHPPAPAPKHASARRQTGEEEKLGKGAAAVEAYIATPPGATKSKPPTAAVVIFTGGCAPHTAGGTRPCFRPRATTASHAARCKHVSGRILKGSVAEPRYTTLKSSTTRLSPRFRRHLRLRRPQPPPVGRPPGQGGLPGCGAGLLPR